MSLADRPAVAYAAIAAIGLAVISPHLSAAPKDSFPLSTYPMFSSGRKDATVTVEHVVAIGEGGSEEAVPPHLVGSDEVLQAKATIARAARRGPTEAQSLCRAIAERARARGELGGATRLEVRTTRHDAVAWFVAAGEGRPPPPPLSSKRHASCALAGGDGA